MKRFEVVQRMVHLLEGSSGTVRHSCRVIDAAGLSREIDVLIDDQVRGENLRIIVECRHHKRKVDVGYIEQVVTKGKDLGCHIVHVVSTGGFTSGAIAKAKVHAVHLSSLLEIDESSWPVWIRGMPVVEGRPYIVVHGSTVDVAPGTPMPEGMPEGFSDGGSPGVVLYEEDGTRRLTLGEALQKDFPPDLFRSVDPFGPTASTRKSTYYQIPNDRVRCLRFPSGLVPIVGVGLDLEFGWKRVSLIPTYSEYLSVRSQARKGGAVSVQMTDGSHLLIVERTDGRLFAQRLHGGGQSVDVPVMFAPGSTLAKSHMSRPAST